MAKNNVINFDFKKASEEKTLSEAKTAKSNPIAFSDNELQELLSIFEKGNQAGLFKSHLHIDAENNLDSSAEYEEFRFCDVDEEDFYDSPVISAVKILTDDGQIAYVSKPNTGKQKGYLDFEGLTFELNLQIDALLQEKEASYAAPLEEEKTDKKPLRAISAARIEESRDKGTSFSERELKALIGAFNKGKEAGLFMHYHVYDKAGDYETFHIYTTEKGDEHSVPALSLIKLDTGHGSCGYVCAPIFGDSDSFETFESAMANLQQRISGMIHRRNNPAGAPKLSPH